MSARVYEAGEGIHTVDLAGSVMTSKEDGSTSDGAFVVAEGTLAPGSFAPPLHLHREIAESVYVLSGELDLQVGDDRRIAGPGTFASIPPGVAHTMSVAGEEPVRMLIVLSNPARATQMFDVLEQAFADGEPDPETAGAMLAQLDMEILASTP